MKVVGITAEYDPMHTGHIYHLGEARAVSTADFVVAVMSGDFTQRGEPALLDKWTRAKIAAENGIDLVLELPFAYACNSAEYFAYGAMEIMKRLGVVTHVAFGAESQNLQQLQEIAALLRAEIEMPEAGSCGSTDMLEAPEAGKVAVYRKALRRELAAGRSFAAARGAAIGECLGPAAGTAAAAPNNLLAIEYLKFAGGMTPVLIPRTAPHHADTAATADAAPSDTAGDAAAAGTPGANSNALPESAGAIRRAIFAGLVGADTADDPDIASLLANAPIPENTRTALLEAATSGNAARAEDSGFGVLGNKERFYDMLMSKLLTMTADDLACIFSVTEGMENRILDARRRCSDMESLIETVKTKRYPYTSISRMLMHTLVGFEKMDLRAAAQTGDSAGNNNNLYGHILAASANGRKLLRILKDDPHCTLPLFGTVERDQAEAGASLSMAEGENPAAFAKHLLALDIRAADLYNQATGRDLYRESDYVKHPFMGA